MPVLAALCLREGDRMPDSALVLAGGGARATLASAFCAGPCIAELALPSACPLQGLCEYHCGAALRIALLTRKVSTKMCKLPSARSHIASQYTVWHGVLLRSDTGACADAHLAGRDIKGLVKEAPGALLMLAAGLLIA